VFQELFHIGDLRLVVLLVLMPPTMATVLKLALWLGQVIENQAIEYDD